MFVMMLHNHYSLHKLKAEGVVKINKEQQGKHKIVYHVLHFLALTDMELICLMPWQEIEDANGFPFGAVKPARFAAGVEDGVQLLMQVVYLICKSGMDWATVPSMCLTIGSWAFRFFVTAEQTTISASSGSTTSIKWTTGNALHDRTVKAAFRKTAETKNGRGVELPPQRDSSDLRKTRLTEALRAQGLRRYADVLWDLGVNEPRTLATLEWEDIKDTGIKKLELKTLVRIGQNLSTTGVVAEVTNHVPGTTDAI